MAYRKGEARTALASRRASEFSVGTDGSEIAPTPLEIQTARIRARYDFSPSLAAAIAELAFTSSGSWRATR
ncbi:hypothetical protein SAMN02799622_03546 [Methylobacterium sp. UNC378MF]|nr:hypothetical protein SAMN02799622_03546 [Methylobacterium sp. UNC378MF]